MVRPEGLPPVHFHCARGFYARTLAWTLDSLVRVSRRAARRHYASTLAVRRGPRPGQAVFRPGLQHPRRGRIPGAFIRPPRPVLARRPGEYAGRVGRRSPRGRVLAACASPAAISRAV